jgi:hypothetical protein
VNVQPDLGHPLETPNPDAPNTFGKVFGQRCPAGFNEQLNEDLQDWHPGIVALSGPSVKAGKLGCDQGGSANFSPLCRPVVLGYLDSTMDREQKITLRDLYPTFSEEQIAEAEANFRRYLAVVIGIAERLHREGRSILDDLETDSGPDLTVSPVSPMIPDERSNNS